MDQYAPRACRDPDIGHHESIPQLLASDSTCNTVDCNDRCFRRGPARPVGHGREVLAPRPTFFIGGDERLADGDRALRLAKSRESDARTIAAAGCSESERGTC